MNNWINKGMTIATIVLLAILAGIIGYSASSKKKETARMEALQEEIRPYEEEIAEIRQEMNERAAENTQDSEIGQILIGYCVSSADDFEKLETDMQTYDFSPVVVLDCTMDLSELKDILKGMQGESFEVVLTGTPLSNEILDTADSVRKLQTQYGFQDTAGFLLRKVDDTSEKLNQLYERGYTSLAKYSSSLKSGVTALGVPYIPYNYVTSNTYASGGVDDIVSGKSVLFTVFDMESVKNKKLNMDSINNALDYIKKKVDEGSLSYSSVGDVMDKLRNADSWAAAQRKEYEEYEAQQQERIDVLEEKIHEAYARLEN